MIKLALFFGPYLAMFWIIFGLLLLKAYFLSLLQNTSFSGYHCLPPPTPIIATGCHHLWGLRPPLPTTTISLKKKKAPLFLLVSKSSFVVNVIISYIAIEGFFSFLE
jgi:hypothetical protein